MPWVPPQQDSLASGFAKGATQGLQNFVMPVEEERQKSKLGLQMLSQRLQMEHEANQRQEVFQHGLNTIPAPEMTSIGAQMGTVLNSIKTGAALPAIDFSGLQTPQGQQAGLKAFGELASAVASRARMDKPVMYKVTDPNTGKVMTHFVDPMTGQVTASLDGGLSTKAEGDISTGRNAYFNMRNFADTTQAQLAQFVHANTALASAAQAGTLTLNQLSQADPKAKAFIDNLPYNAASLDKRTLGSIRAGGQKLMDATQQAIFSKNDTWPTVIQKMDMLRGAGVDQVKSAYQNHQVPFPSDVPELKAPTAPAPQGQPAPASDPVADFKAWQARRDAQAQGPQAQ